MATATVRKVSSVPEAEFWAGLEARMVEMAKAIIDALPKPQALTPVKDGTVVNTAVGPQVIGDKTAAGTVYAGPGGPRQFYWESDPQTWKNDPSRVTRYGDLYGPKWLAVFKTYETVKEHKFYGFVANDAQAEMFMENGERAYATVAQLIMRTDPKLELSMFNITQSQLYQMWIENKGDEKIWNKKLVG